mgnify:CR=1 FL=1
MRRKDVEKALVDFIALGADRENNDLFDYLPDRYTNHSPGRENTGNGLDNCTTTDFSRVRWRAIESAGNNGAETVPGK